MAHKTISSSKQTQKIVTNEPSNIFEYSMIKKIQKPARVVNFNDLISNNPVKKTLKEPAKQNSKKYKKQTTRFVDFDCLVGEVKEEKKVVEVKPRTFKNRVLAFIKKDSTITDVIKSYVIEKSKRSKSVYLENLKEKLSTGGVCIEDTNLEKELEQVDRQIEEIEKDDLMWKEVKEDVRKIHSFYSTNFDELLKRFECCMNYKEEDFMRNIEKEKTKVDEKIKNKLNRLEFLRDSVLLNIQNLNVKIDEDEKKLFNLTENNSSLDTMVLLKAITKSK